MKLLKLQKVVAISLSVATLCFTLVQWNKPITKEQQTYDNVIIMIGDGMGENHLKSAKQAYNIEKLNMETMPVRGQSQTNNVIGTITDSAAGGTALSCGIRTINSFVGTYFYDPLRVFSTPKNLSEVAIGLGKSAGVVTTDQTSGATPATFSAHVFSRNEGKMITKQQLKSDLDLIWGGASGYATEEDATKYGFELVTNADELISLDGSTRSFAQFNFDDLKHVTNTDITPTLDVMTEKAIDILDNNEKGFSLMVEGACIDKASHSNEMDAMTKNLIEFDKAVKVALDYAKADGNTLVVVTADHETGGITYNETTQTYSFTTSSHTGANVPLFVSDVNAGFTNGVAVKNREIGAQLGLDLGAEYGSYPCSNGTNVILDLF